MNHSCKIFEITLFNQRNKTKVSKTKVTIIKTRLNTKLQKLNCFKKLKKVKDFLNTSIKAKVSKNPEKQVNYRLTYLSSLDNTFKFFCDTI